MAEKGTDDRARCPFTGQTAPAGGTPGRVLPKNSWGKGTSSDSQSATPSSPSAGSAPGHNVGGAYGASSDFHDQGGAAKRPGRGGFPVMYHSYLQLDKVLQSQTLMSARRMSPDGKHCESVGFGPDGKGAHDEHLFIIIHQVSRMM